jgi:hypothetical protein
MQARFVLIPGRFDALPEYFSSMMLPDIRIRIPIIIVRIRQPETGKRLTRQNCQHTTV